MPMSTTKIANSERQFAQAIHCQSFVKLPQSQQVVLQVKDGSMHFGQRLLWQDVNFSILSGEFVALRLAPVQVRQHCCEVYSNLCRYPVVQSRLAKIFEWDMCLSSKTLRQNYPFGVGTWCSWGWMGKIICLVCLAPKNLRRFLADSKNKNIWWIKPLRKSAANHFVMHRLPCSRVVSSSACVSPKPWSLSLMFC